MIKRMLTQNRLFSGLFLFSLCIVFFICYFGMSIIRQEKKTRYVLDNTYMETDYIFDGTWDEDVRDDITELSGELKKGFVTVRCLVGAGRRLNISAEIRLEKDTKEGIVLEDLSEPASMDGTYCYIGERLKSEMTEIQGDRYIDIFGIQVKVAGILMPLGGDDFDERIVIFGADENTDLWNRCLNFSEIRIRYRSEFKEDECALELEKIYGICEKRIIQLFGVTKSEEHIEYSLMTSNDMIEMYKFVGILLIVFAGTGLVLVMVVWSIEHRYQYVIKKLVGFSTRDIIMYALAEVFVIETAGLGLSSGIAFIYEMANGTPGLWIENYRAGGIVIGICFFAQLFLAMCIALFWVRRANITEIIKNKE